MANRIEWNVRSSIIRYYLIIWYEVYNSKACQHVKRFLGVYVNLGSMAPPPPCSHMFSIRRLLLPPAPATVDRIVVVVPYGRWVVSGVLLAVHPSIVHSFMLFFNASQTTAVLLTGAKE